VSGKEGMAELIGMDAVELVRLIRTGNVSPLEVKEATLFRASVKRSSLD